MARDGSGTYDRVHADYVDGTTIEADDINGELNDMASALTQSLSKDGQTVPTANLPMGSFKLTGLSRGTGTGDSIRYDEFKAAFRSLLVGCGTSNNAGTPNTKIDVAAGSFTEAGQTAVFALSAGTIDCGATGANGLDAGSLANNTWYHSYAIAKADATTALLASTSVSSPTMPSGYTLKRRIGSFKTNGSAQIIAFTQTGDRFEWTTATADVSTTATASGNYTFNVPTGVSVVWFGAMKLSYTSGTGSLTVSLLAPGQSAPSGTAHVGFVAAANAIDQCYVEMRTNTSAQVAFRGDGTGSLVGSIGIVTQGWIDRRGRDD